MAFRSQGRAGLLPSLMPPLLPALVSAWMLAAGAAQAACYTIYNAKNEIIYRDTAPPLDLSRAPSENLPDIAPRGSRLVFSPDSGICTERIDELTPGGRDLGTAGREAEGLRLRPAISPP